MSDTHVEPSDRPRDAVFAMSAPDATAALAAMTVKFNASQRPVITEKTPPAVVAHHRLAELEGDAAFRSKLLAGDVEANETYRKLNATVSDPAALTDFALHGLVPQGHVEGGVPGAMPLSAQVQAAQDFRELGIGDVIIREGLTGHDSRKPGKPFDPATVAAAKVQRNAMHSDADWRKRYLSGDRSLMRVSQTQPVILASEQVDL